MFVSEAWDVTNSMVRRQIVIKMNDRAGAYLEGDFAINIPYGAVQSYLEP